ncbi:MAG: DUF1415 domain-containing protein [Halieaceae bacterium]|jgi:hypothetical protein|nr:DUF1415 domain-containing protein [Halieaceae bacterium]
MNPSTSNPPSNSEPVIAATRRWVARVVVGHNLCPFARRELEADSVRFAVSDAKDEEGLLLALVEELELLRRLPTIETTLLIHPQVLQDFFDYNQFLGACEALLLESGLEGVFQVASFHPDYQFAGTRPEDAENYSNRSPYPMLHILREDSVARAVAGHPDVEGIPERNIAMLEKLGAERLRATLQDCISGEG